MTKDLYDQELAHRAQLQGAIGTPLSMLTLLGGTIGVLFPRLPSLAGVPFWIAASALSVSAVALGYGVYALVRSYIGYVYEGLPLAAPLFEHRKALAEYYRIKNGSPEEGEREFESLIDERRIAAATRNALHNIRRGAFLHKANIAIVVAAFFVAVAAVPSVLYVQKDTSPIKVQLVTEPETTHDGRQQPQPSDERLPGNSGREAPRDSAR